MAISKKALDRGIILTPDDVGVIGIEGEMKVGLTSKKLHVYLDGALRSMVSENQTQTLTNKTIVAANNTITTAPSGTLEAVELNAALAELEAQASSIDAAKVTGPASSTDNAITRFDGTTGKLVKNSSVLISDAGAVTGAQSVNAGNIKVSANTIESTNANGNIILAPNGTGEIEATSPKLKVSQSIAFPAALISASGANQNLVLDPAKVYRNVDNTLVSVDTITFGSSTVTSGQEITILNVSGVAFTINHMTGTPTNRRIYSPTGANLVVDDGATVNLTFNSIEQYWIASSSLFKSNTTSLDNTIPRFDGTSGQRIQGSGVTVNDSNEVSGITKLDIDNLRFDGNTISNTGGNNIVIQPESGDKISMDGPVQFYGRFGSTITTDAATTGTNATITPATKVTLLTNASLQSIRLIVAGGDVDGQEITFINLTGNNITLVNGGLSGQIKTGTGNNFTFKNEAAVSLVYNQGSGLWHISGGAGSGEVIVSVTAGENLALNDLVYISASGDTGRTPGQAYKVDPTNDNRIEAVGFVVAAVSAGTAVTIKASGAVETLSGLTEGKVYFASTTPGAITDTAPSATSQWSIPVGIAVSSTTLVINPVASASAVYITESESSFTIANAQASAADVTGLLIDPISYRAATIHYSIYRQTDTALSGVAQTGQLRIVYNSQAGVFKYTDDYAGDNSGVSLTVTAGGQIQYTSTNIAGSNYTGTMKYSITRTFSI